jgi:hypothetical protein
MLGIKGEVSRERRGSLQCIGATMQRPIEATGESALMRISLLG